MHVETPAIKTIIGSGAVDVRADIPETSSLKLDFTGAAKATVTGSAGDTKILAAGAARIDGSRLCSTKLLADASGATVIEAYVHEKGVARASASGAAVVKIYGKPQDRHNKVSGVGKVVYR